MPKKPKKPSLDDLIEQAYCRLNRIESIQVNIMDIPKIYADCTEAVKAGTDLDEAMKVAVAKYRLN